MKQRNAQIKINLKRPQAWRALLLTLLLMQPAWALNLCFCQLPSEPQHECCATNAPTTQASAQGSAQTTGPKVAHHCAAAETTPVEPNQSKDQPQTKAQCCDMMTEAETVATIDAPQHREPIVTTATYLPCVALNIALAAPFEHPSPPQARPLYLTYSCLLI